MNKEIVPFTEMALMEQFLKENTKEHVYVRTPTPVKVKTSTTARDVRGYIENFTLFRKISNPEWNLLKGRFSNKKIQTMTKAEILKVIDA
jgi:hypothetical protein